MFRFNFQMCKLCVLSIGARNISYCDNEPRMNIHTGLTYQDYFSIPKECREINSNIQDILIKFNPTIGLEQERENNYLSLMGTKNYLQNLDNLNMYRQYYNKIMIDALQKDGNHIKNVKFQKQTWKMEAVKQNGYSIQYIENPDKEVQLEAVNQNAYSIQYIINPDKEVQLAAIKKDGYSIKYIENPYKEVQIEAVKHRGYLIKYIENPCKESQMEAIRQNKKNIKHIKNPCI